MKLLSQHGKKVLEAPIEAENAYASFVDDKGVNKLVFTLEVYTSARDTQYFILLDHKDIGELRKILEGT